MIKKITTYFALGLVGTILLPFESFAQTAVEESAPGVSALMTSILEYLILAGLVIGLLVMWQVVSKFGSSLMGKLFRYFLVGSVFLLVMRLFIHFVELDILSIASGALHFWWHVIFYLSLLSFFFGLKGLVNIADGKEDKISNRVGNWQFFSVMAIAVIYFLAITTGNSLAGFYDGALFENAGVHHFIAFALSLAVVYYLLQSKKKIGMIGTQIATPFILSLSLFGIQHLWELLTESWKILSVPDAQIEQVEQYMVLIAVVALIYGFLQLKKVTIGNSSSSAV